MTLFEIVFLTAILVGLGLFIYALVVQERKKKNVWQIVGDRLGFAVNGFELMGTLDEVTVRVYFEARSAGNPGGQGLTGRREFTVFVAQIEATPKGLYLASEGLAAKIEKVFGTQDIQLGVPAFDQKLVVRWRRAVEGP